MFTSTEKNLKITLMMNEQEARWLKDFIQNHPNYPHEPEEDRAIRYEMFNYLQEALS